MTLRIVSPTRISHTMRSTLTLPVHRIQVPLLLLLLLMGAQISSVSSFASWLVERSSSCFLNLRDPTEVIMNAHIIPANQSQYSDTELFLQVMMDEKQFFTDSWDSNPPHHHHQKKKTNTKDNQGTPVVRETEKEERLYRVYFPTVHPSSSTQDEESIVDKMPFGNEKEMILEYTLQLQVPPQLRDLQYVMDLALVPPFETEEEFHNHPTTTTSRSSTTTDDASRKWNEPTLPFARSLQAEFVHSSKVGCHGTRIHGRAKDTEPVVLRITIPSPSHVHSQEGVHVIAGWATGHEAVTLTAPILFGPRPKATKNHFKEKMMEEVQPNKTPKNQNPMDVEMDVNMDLDVDRLLDISLQRMIENGKEKKEEDVDGQQPLLSLEQHTKSMDTNTTTQTHQSNESDKATIVASDKISMSKSETTTTLNNISSNTTMDTASSNPTIITKNTDTTVTVTTATTTKKKKKISTFIDDRNEPSSKNQPKKNLKSNLRSNPSSSFQKGFWKHSENLKKIQENLIQEQKRKQKLTELEAKRLKHLYAKSKQNRIDHESLQKIVRVISNFTRNESNHRHVSKQEPIRPDSESSSSTSHHSDGSKSKEKQKNYILFHQFRTKYEQKDFGSKYFRFRGYIVGIIIFLSSGLIIKWMIPQDRRNEIKET